MSALLRKQLLGAEAFVFDFYGTLASDDVSVPCAWEILQRLGYTTHPDLEAMFEPNAYDGLLTPSDWSTPSHEEWAKSSWHQFLALSGVPECELGSVFEMITMQKAEYRMKQVSGAVELLEELQSRRYKIAICSNWESPIHPFLTQAKLPNFDAVVTSCEAGARKPNVKIFSDVCQQLGVDPRQVVFVGDTWSSDVVGALRAGMRPVWIRRDAPSRGLTHWVSEFGCLQDFALALQRLWREGRSPMGTHSYPAPATSSKQMAIGITPTG